MRSTCSVRPMGRKCPPSHPNKFELMDGKKCCRQERFDRPTSTSALFAPVDERRLFEAKSILAQQKFEQQQRKRKRKLELAEEAQKIAAQKRDLVQMSAAADRAFKQRQKENWEQFKRAEAAREEEHQLQLEAKQARIAEQLYELDVKKKQLEITSEREKVLADLNAQNKILEAKRSLSNQNLFGGGIEGVNDADLFNMMRDRSTAGSGGRGWM